MKKIINFRGIECDIEVDKDIVIPVTSSIKYAVFANAFIVDNCYSISFYEDSEHYYASKYMVKSINGSPVQYAYLSQEMCGMIQKDYYISKFLGVNLECVHLRYGPGALPIYNDGYARFLYVTKVGDLSINYVSTGGNGGPISNYRKEIIFKKEKIVLIYNEKWQLKKYEIYDAQGRHAQDIDL